MGSVMFKEAFRNKERLVTGEYRDFAQGSGGAGQHEDGPVDRKTADQRPG
jgi:hypothetical protein